MTPTHTHREHGGRYALLSEHHGGGALAGQQLVIYADLDKECSSATTADDWRQHWRAIAADDCTVCLGAGTDQIKGNTDRPCGGCYGLGKVQANGETPAELWDLASVATGIINRLCRERDDDRRQLADPEVQAFIQHRHQQRLDDSTARAEHQWRDGRGRGPMGQRHTGD